MISTATSSVIVTQYCWGEAWGDDTLPPRERSILNLGMIASLGKMHEFETHVRGALRNGLTPDELRAVLTQIAVYCGIPIGVDCFRIARQVINEGKTALSCSERRAVREEESDAEQWSGSWLLVDRSRWPRRPPARRKPIRRGRSPSWRRSRPAARPTWSPGVVSDGLRNKLGQPVIVENKPGGTGIIGTREVVKAAPDGYTLVLGNVGSLVIPAAMNPDFPIDPIRDLVPISLSAEFVGVMLAKKDLPVGTLRGVHRLRQGAPRRAEFRHLRRRQSRPSVGRAADAAGRT